MERSVPTAEEQRTGLFFNSNCKDDVYTILLKMKLTFLLDRFSNAEFLGLKVFLSVFNNDNGKAIIDDKAWVVYLNGAWKNNVHLEMMIVAQSGVA
jgi:hypothetical protein